jgi:hypothetical protein
MAPQTGTHFLASLTEEFSQLLGESGSVVHLLRTLLGKVSHAESHRVDFEKLRCRHHCRAFVAVMEKMSTENTSYFGS